MEVAVIIADGGETIADHPLSQPGRSQPVFQRSGVPTGPSSTATPGWFPRVHQDARRHKDAPACFVSGTGHDDVGAIAHIGFHPTAPVAGFGDAQDIVEGVFTVQGQGVVVASRDLHEERLR